MRPTGRRSQPNAHLVAPALTRLPAGLLNEVGGGVKGIGNGIDQIPAAVAVAVDRKTEIGGGG